MKTILILSAMLLMAITQVNAQCCSSAAATADCGTPCAEATALTQDVDVDDVQVLYFHATRRCATCQAVEEETVKTLKEAFNNKVPFQSINREEDKKNPLLKKYKVNGQTLLIIKGDKVVNLTNDAFMYARTSPEKFNEKLKETIQTM